MFYSYHISVGYAAVVGLCNVMGRSYVISGTSIAILLCACVVMATSDVTDKPSPSSSSSSRDSLRKIFEELRLLSQVTNDLRSQTSSLTSNVVSDYGELVKRLPDKANNQWDTDYGWGGGRFGKRHNVSHHRD